jgi:predicted MFS family arabinose efflux permease
MLMAGWVPLYGVVLAGLVLAGLAKNVFDPAVQAFVGERITFRRRARVIGILEFSWAGSTLLGVPVVGILIDRFGWRAPFFVLGAMGLLGLLVLGWTISGYQQPDGALRSRDGIWRSWQKLVRQPRALTAMAFGFLISAANDNLFVVYGAWLESSFQLGVVALGFGTALIGVAEFLGEVSTAAWADRFGLKASVITGLTLSMLSYLMLPVISRNLTLAFFALFVVFIVFEFTVVAFLSLCTELVPEMRATMMSMLLAAAGIGRMVGALMGGPVWLAGGIAATAAISALTSALALACLIWGLRGWKPQ